MLGLYLIFWADGTWNSAYGSHSANAWERFIDKNPEKATKDLHVMISYEDLTDGYKEVIRDASRINKEGT